MDKPPSKRQKIDMIKSNGDDDDGCIESIVIKAPIERSLPDGLSLSVFLSGSIEMGKAIDWQTALSAEIVEEVKKRMNELGKGSTQGTLVFFNPRRDDWDSSWVQERENVQFRSQVEWELSGMEEADIVAMNFCPDTQSPITLLELGLCARSKKENTVVLCPKGFWRRGNVDVVCLNYGMTFVANWAELVDVITTRAVSHFTQEQS